MQDCAAAGNFEFSAALKHGLDVHGCERLCSGEGVVEGVAPLFAEVLSQRLRLDLQSLGELTQG